MCLVPLTVVLLPYNRCDLHFFHMTGTSHYMIGRSHDVNLSKYCTKKHVHEKEVILVFILCRALLRLGQAGKKHRSPKHLANRSAIDNT